MGVEFLNKNKVIIDFDNKNLYFSNHKIPFKQNNTDRLFSVNQLVSEQTSPLVDVLNRELKCIGKFLIDTGSEGNLIKIWSLPADCEIDINKIVYLKGIGENVIQTLGSAEITIFGHQTNF